MACLDLDCNETGVPREAAYRNGRSLSTPLSVVDAIAELSKIIRVHIAGNQRLHLECQTGAVVALLFGFLLDGKSAAKSGLQVSAES
jgi:hypothetical protein